MRIGGACAQRALARGCVVTCVLLCGCADIFGVDFDHAHRASDPEAPDAGDPCPEGRERACYSGPNATLNVGVCRGGTQTCGDDGAWGACNGERLPSPEDAAIGLDTACDGPSGIHLWSESFGNETYNVARTAIDSEGRIAVAMDYHDTIQIGETTLTSDTGDVAVFVLSPDGEVQWVRSFGSEGNDGASDIAMDEEGNVIVPLEIKGTIQIDTDVSYTSEGAGRDVCVLKLGDGGDCIWHRCWGDIYDDRAYAVAAMGTLVVVGGAYEGTFEGGHVPIQDSFDPVYNGYVLGLHAQNGSDLWAYPLQGDGDQDVRRLAIDPSTGAIAVLGTGDLPFGPFDASSSGAVAYLLELNAEGQLVDSKKKRVLVSTEHDIAEYPASDLALDSAGNIYVALGFGPDPGNQPYIQDTGLASTGGLDALIMSFDDELQYRWGVRFGDGADSSAPTRQVASSIAVDDDGTVVVGGDFAGTIDFGAGTIQAVDMRDAFMAKLDPTGAVRWYRVMRASQDQAIVGIDIDRLGTSHPIVIGAITRGAVSFGGDPLPYWGYWDSVVAKFGP